MSSRSWFRVRAEDGLVIVEIFPMQDGATIYLNPEDADYLASLIDQAILEARREQDPRQGR